jgi:hypothetical protein
MGVCISAFLWCLSLLFVGLLGLSACAFAFQFPRHLFGRHIYIALLASHIYIKIKIKTLSVFLAE